MKRFLIPLFLLLTLACQLSGNAPTPVVTNTALPAPTVETTLPATATMPAFSPTNTPNTLSPNTPIPQPTTPILPTIEPPQPTGDQSRPPTDAEIAAYDRFAHSQSPDRNDIALAIAFKGVTDIPAPPPLVTQPLAVGTIQDLAVLNISDNTISTITAELKAVGEHAYFWFDTNAPTPQANDLAEATAAFDTIYNQAVALFGSENNPGADGDPRVHVVNASPVAVCGSGGGCGLAGYYSGHDTLPKAVDPNSNQREMFVMNSSNFGSQFYISVLAHEFRHMIEDNYDAGDRDWEVEGSAMLAETLLGYGGEAQSRASQFMNRPDQQLTNWSDGGTIPHYGQGYLFNRYLYDQLGEDLYRLFAQSPLDGFVALDEIATVSGDVTLAGKSLWLDWLVAMAIHQQPNLPPRYELHDESLRQVAMEEMGDSGVQETSVEQFAADYYRLTGDGEVGIDFAGISLVNVMDKMPANGDHMWVADRHNYSDARLTRAVDLSNVAQATLDYSVYHDIEYGYDFAYVSVSTDGGNTWQGLVGDTMQGLQPTDDPSHSALTNRFYTGNSVDWLHESIDLTPFAGQEILIRFEYVTDPILTFAGIAFDNISIPEIGFFDAGNSLDDGWQVEGFVRTTAYIPQTWHVQLITFPAGQTPLVSRLPLQDGVAKTRVNLANSGGEAILIISAASPMTLTDATYRLEIAD